MKRLAIITTHPIQYYAPLFRFINNQNQNVAIKVFYTLGDQGNKIKDPDFGISFQWDVPLLEGYDFTFVNNISRKPGTRQFKGIINPTLISEIENWKANAILVIGWAFKGHLDALRHFRGRIPVLFRGDSNLIDEFPGISIKKIIRRLFLYWIYRHVDYALYVGEVNKEYYLAHGMKQKQLLFAPHAIDNERFTRSDDEYETKARSRRAELGISENDFVFLFAGKLTKKKDPEILIKAFVELNKTGTRLIIVGNGELEVQLKEQYKTFTNIIFLPFQNQSLMPVVYRLANMFVLPSQGPEETWGLAVNEAMACKRGVIVSNKCGCAADLVINGRNGFVFKSRHIESLKKAMEASLTSYKNFGDHSYQIIQNWSFVNINQQLKSIAEKQLI